MDEKKSVEEYMAELKDIVMLETSLCRQEKTLKAYADYTYVPQAPPQYRNRASLGMISLSVTWVLFDIFAYFMKYTKVSVGASIFTAALIIFFIALQRRGIKANQKLLAEYEEYRNLNAVCAIYDYLESGRASDIYGSESVYRLYDKEMQKGNIPDKSREIESNITSAEQIPEYYREIECLIDDIEKRNQIIKQEGKDNV